ncbi:hypothetical protein DFS34DRAFT_364798 [Phlyctochytrium arcticum]|nr:hypothetical protein DFS34DRAFT_364798 [Phlyctochytrium arcticum]
MSSAGAAPGGKEPSAIEKALSIVNEAGAKNADKKKKKGKKRKAPSIPKDMVLNARGELITSKEFALEQTLEATSKSLGQYRERMDNLVNTNENLQETCQQQEKDALDVIAALHRENEKKELQIKELKGQIEYEVIKAQNEREDLNEEHERRTSEMNALLAEKEAAFNVMQQEFSVIKDFRRKRHELLKELEQQKAQLVDTERRHKDTVARMERKFFEEKIRLQKEANRKISELATKAHKEAVVNLKETTKEVFRQNIRMAEALRYHVEEGEELGKSNSTLTQTNKYLLEEKELHDVIVKEKILQSKQQHREISELHAKIQSMEHSLSHVVREFEHERELVGRLARQELDDVRKIALELKETVRRKTFEMKHIKRLAQHILNQRTDLERFFLDSLEHVKSQILHERQESKRVRQAEYQSKLRMALAMKGNPSHVDHQKLQPLRSTVPLPPGKHPSPANDSTRAQLDIHDLAWEDKEKILRLLFARMNGLSLVGTKSDPKPESDQYASVESESYLLRSAPEGREVDIDDDDDGEYWGHAPQQSEFGAEPIIPRGQSDLAITS